MQVSVWSFHQIQIPWPVNRHVPMSPPASKNTWKISRNSPERLNEINRKNLIHKDEKMHAYIGMKFTEISNIFSIKNSVGKTVK